MSRAVGVDVAARRGCDVVTLDDHLIARPMGRVHTADELAALLGDLRPDVVAIDAPPRWAAPNKRRDCERELTKRAISLFTTPTEERGSNNPFYAWMLTGFEMFDAARGYPTLETFPHAIAVAIHGRCPQGTKNRTRRAALTSVGVDVRELRNIDQVDAALCAYTAWAWLHDQSVSVGDHAEGQITLPVTALLDRYVRS